MSQFRLTQISDTHLSRHFPDFTENFNRLREHIDTTRPHLVINSGDLTFDAPTSPDDIEFARSLHEALPVPCRYLPGNHDIGDNPTRTGPIPTHPVTEERRRAFTAAFGDDRWRFDAAGWCFIGLNAMLMNSGLDSEAEQLDWLESQLSASGGRPVAVFLHKPVFLDTPADGESEQTAIRYVPMPARQALVDRLCGSNVRLVASGHLHQRRDYTYSGIRYVWAPSAGFIISDARQERIGTKEVGLVEYRFQPDGFEVRHLRAPGQSDIELETVLGRR